MCTARSSLWLLKSQQLHPLGAYILPSNSSPLLSVIEENERARQRGGVELFSREWTNMMYVRDGTRSKYVTRGSSEDWAGPWPVDNYSFGCVNRYHCYEQCFSYSTDTSSRTFLGLPLLGVSNWAFLSTFIQAGTDLGSQKFSFSFWRAGTGLGQPTT